jgi:hypothetical protein
MIIISLIVQNALEGRNLNKKASAHGPAQDVFHCNAEK